MSGSSVSLSEQFSRLWCRAFHPQPMWPVNGYYRCPECLRAYPVPWANRRYGPHPAELQAATPRPRVVPISRPAGKTA
jgi:hypothetical protein